MVHPEPQSSLAALFHENGLPVFETQCDQVAVVVEVNESLAWAFLNLASQIWQEIVTVDMHLESFVAGLVTFLELLDDIWLTRCCEKVGSQSWCWMMSFETTPAGIFPVQRTSSGMRNAPSQFVSFSLRKGVMPPSGHEFMCGPLSVL
jgi:hypothetical protein